MERNIPSPSTHPPPGPQKISSPIPNLRAKYKFVPEAYVKGSTLAVTFHRLERTKLTAILSLLKSRFLTWFCVSSDFGFSYFPLEGVSVQMCKIELFRLSGAGYGLQVFPKLSASRTHIY